MYDIHDQPTSHGKDFQRWGFREATVDDRSAAEVVKAERDRHIPWYRCEAAASDLPASGVRTTWSATLFGQRHCPRFEEFTGPGLKFEQYSEARLARREHRSRTVFQFAVLTVGAALVGFLIRDLLPRIF